MQQKTFNLNLKTQDYPNSANNPFGYNVPNMPNQSDFVGIYDLPTNRQVYTDGTNLGSGQSAGAPYETGAGGIASVEQSPREDVLANAQNTMNEYFSGINQAADADYLTKNPGLAKFVIGDSAANQYNLLQNALTQNELALGADLEKADPKKYREGVDAERAKIDAFVKKYANNPARDLEEIKSFYADQEEDIKELYQQDDMSFEKKMALAQFGLSLAGGRSLGGKPFPIIAEAGQQLIDNLAKINASKKASARERKAALLGVKREGQKAVMDAQQQNRAEQLSMEWNAITKGLDVETQLANVTYDIDKENRTINNANTRATYEKNFDLYADYLKEKHGGEPGVVQFMNKRTGTPSKPMIGMRMNDGRVAIPADLSIHPGLAGADGMPLMVDASLYADMSIDNGGITFSSGGELPGAEGLTVKDIQGFNDYQSSLNQTAAAMVGLSQLRTSLQERPDRAGWAGLARSVWQDAYRNVTVAWQSLTGEFANEDIDSEFYKPTANKRYWVTDLLTEDLGTIQVEDGAGNIIRENILSPEQQKGLTAAVTAGQTMLAQDNEAYRAAKAEGLKEFKLTDGTMMDIEQGDLVYPSLFSNGSGYDPDLPRNEVRIQSLIYALARARKASGRLNKDDIERASLTLNLYGKSDLGIDASLREVQREFQTYLRDQVSGFKQAAHNPRDTSGRDPFVSWMTDWIDRGYYIPAYLSPFAQDALPENYYNRATFRDVNDIGVLGTNTAGGTMDIQITGEVVDD